jgi:hypothetical protein
MVFFKSFTFGHSEQYFETKLSPRQCQLKVYNILAIPSLLCGCESGQWNKGM